MDIDPHTLQQILQRIQQQMRCPQCGRHVPVDFSAVRVVADAAMLLQLNCDGCNAFIVLHASLQGVDNLKTQAIEDGTVNASSNLHMSDSEVKMLKSALQQSDGSFEKLFNKYGKEETENKSS